MQQPLKITIKDGVSHSDAIEEQLRKKAEKLEQYCDNIISCHIAVEMPQKHKNQGKLHNVNLKINVPGKELAVSRNMQENLWIAIRDAFNDMRNQLKAYTQLMHKQVKTHPDKLHGEVVRIIGDYGFILGPDGITEYYFNSGNVVWPAFDKLKVGTQVHFIEAMGDDGLQAHRVTATKHHGEESVFIE